MTRNTTLLWIEAGKLIAENPAALVACPVCGSSNLSVTDHRRAVASPELERELCCPSCGARNFLRLIRPIG